MSQSSSDRNESLFAPVLAPSGMFMCNYSVTALYVSPDADAPSPVQMLSDPNHSAPIVYNPMPLKVRQGIKDRVSIANQASFLAEYQRARRYKLFDRRDFDEYAGAIFQKLIPNLSQQNHDLILLPLRGSRQPGILTKLIAGLRDEQLAIFNYTYATQNSQQSQIRTELLGLLLRQLPDQPSASLGIVDTAKGGHGSRHLAQLLASLHRERFEKQIWTVQFHLLHEKGRAPKRAREIPGQGSEKVKFAYPQFHEVESLLVEDWDEGIGLAIQQKQGYYELKRCVRPGRILYRDTDTVQLIESEELCHTMTGLLADAANRLILNHPALEYIKDVF
jgi:hypothetical protein